MPLKQMWQVAWVRNGRVAGWTWYRTEADASRSLGVTE
jgi:hypothetical protein